MSAQVELFLGASFRHVPARFWSAASCSAAMSQQSSRCCCPVCRRLTARQFLKERITCQKEGPITFKGKAKDGNNSTSHCGLQRGIYGLRFIPCALSPRPKLADVRQPDYGSRTCTSRRPAITWEGLETRSMHSLVGMLQNPFWSRCTPDREFCRDLLDRSGGGLGSSLDPATTASRCL